MNRYKYIKSRRE